MSYRNDVRTIRRTEHSVLFGTSSDKLLGREVNSSDVHLGLRVELHAGVLVVLGSHLVIVHLLESPLLVCENVDVDVGWINVELWIKFNFRNKDSLAWNNLFLLGLSLLDLLVLASEVHHCTHTHNCHDKHNNNDDNNLNCDRSS